MWHKQHDEDAKEKAAQHFLLSAKLNPKNGDSFKYLGHYYRSVSLDTQRALKCYQRAVAINPDDFESGVTIHHHYLSSFLPPPPSSPSSILSYQEPLCDLFDQQGKDTLEVAVCVQASQMSPKAFWAFRRLGFLLVSSFNLSHNTHSFLYVCCNKQFTKIKTIFGVKMETMLCTQLLPISLTHYNTLLSYPWFSRSGSCITTVGNSKIIRF